MNAATNIALIADDDKSTIRDLVTLLEAASFQVVLAIDTDHALQLVQKQKPKLVISEIGKTNYDGINLMKTLRNSREFEKLDCKMVVLTNNLEEQLEIESFEYGVDDFLVKPLRKNAFRKRLDRILNYKNSYLSISSDVFEIKDLKFKKELKNLSKDGVPIKIQSKTFDLLYFLALHANQVFSREQLLTKLWVGNQMVTARTVDVHILKIRQLLGPEYVKTIKGVGYIFQGN